MRTFKKFLAGVGLAVLFAFPGIAAEAPQTNLTYTIGAGNIPTITWSNPWATSCTASGSWSGTKAPTGTETLPAITGTVTFRLRCVGTADNKATLSWMRPTQYTDGTALPASDIGGFRVYQGTSATAMNTVTDLSPSTSNYVANALPTGTHYFSVTVLTINGVESAKSTTGSKVIGAAPADEEAVTVRVPNPPTPGAVQ